MAAALIPDLQGTGLDTGPQPVWIKTSAKVSVLVHPSYLMRAHTKEDLTAVVTQFGVPIVQSGETLTVGLVPPWHRFAVGPVIDGKAEILSQDDFVREDERNYVDTFRFKGERIDDKDKRYIPNVRAFVSQKIDTRASGGYPRLCPLGTHMLAEKPKAGAVVYDPAKDTVTPRQVDEVRQAFAAENAEKDRRLAELEAKVNELVGRKVDPAAANAGTLTDVRTVFDNFKTVRDKPAKPQATSKCGAWTGDATRLNSHVRFCKKGCKPEV
jgi:hypothetical protein